jgi:DNA-binding NarL/FixJ family response regulator
MLNVMIVDDQDLLLQGLSMIVSSKENLKVVATASNGKQALNLLEEVDVDVCLMDIRMPVVDGVIATKLIKEKYPDIKVIILTTFKDDEYIFKSIEYGASGYLLKDATPDEITNAIVTVSEGGTLIDPVVASRVVDFIKNNDISIKNDDDFGLTDRERDICHLLAEGMNNKEIGEKLFISEGTVKNNITKILTKLELRDRTQLALFSMKNKL